MISKGKPAFDPKVFLSKVNGGRAISGTSEGSSCLHAGPAWRKDRSLESASIS